jgi:hypothetical protein
MTTSADDRRDGIVVGLLAYVAVAVFYSIFDFLAARGPLFTVNWLGKALFRGLRDPSVLQAPLGTDWGGVFSYNAFHLAASLVIGLVVVRLVSLAEQGRVHPPAILFVIVAGFATTILAAGWLSAPIRSVLPWWSIVAANAAAVIAGAFYLMKRRPGVVDRLVPVVR